MSAARADAAGGALDHGTWLANVRALHERVRERCRDLLERARASGDRDLAAEPGSWGAGDISYALDEAVDPLLHEFGEELARSRRVTLIAEGPGELTFEPGGRSGVGSGARVPAEAAADAPVRVIVDPVDGTRSLMHDLRSAWVVTGVARDAGPATRLSDVEVAVQTELPTTSAARYHVLSAVRGGGARIALHDVETGDLLEERPLVAPEPDRLDNGYFAFTRYLPVERPLIARLEKLFLDRAIAEHRLSPRLIYDDQYLCSAGQLALVATGRYRMLADLRAWLGRTRDLDGFTAKPYDVGALLVFEEAGCVVLGDDLQPLDAPLDTETKLSVVAFPTPRLRAAFEPALRAAMEIVAERGA